MSFLSSCGTEGQQSYYQWGVRASFRSGPFCQSPVEGNQRGPHLDWEPCSSGVRRPDQNGEGVKPSLFHNMLYKFTLFNPRGITVFVYHAHSHITSETCTFHSNVFVIKMKKRFAIAIVIHSLILTHEDKSNKLEPYEIVFLFQIPFIFFSNSVFSFFYFQNSVFYDFCKFLLILSSDTFVN